MLNGIKKLIKAVDAHPLASKHKLATYTRLIKWQLSSRLSPGMKKVPFVGNCFLLAKKGMTGATGNIYFGLHEFQDMGFLLHFLRKEDSFMDIGANIGSYSVLAAGVVGAGTISFEPVPSTFAYLSENIKLNKLEGITDLRNAAAGAEKGKLFMTTGLDTVNHVIASGENDPNSTEVDVLPVDAFLDSVRQIRLIKIDAEGFETEVIRGMNNILQNDDLKAIIIELNGSGERYGYHDEDIHRKLTNSGFEPFRYDPFSRRLSPINGIDKDNTIYIRDRAFVEERLRTAPKIKVHSEYI